MGSPPPKSPCRRIKKTKKTKNANRKITRYTVSCGYHVVVGNCTALGIKKIGSALEPRMALMVLLG